MTEQYCGHVIYTLLFPWCWPFPLHWGVLPWPIVTSDQVSLILTLSLTNIPHTHAGYSNYLNSACPGINSHTYLIWIIRANGLIRSLDSIKIVHLKLKIYIIRSTRLQIGRFDNRSRHLDEIYRSKMMIRFGHISRFCDRKFTNKKLSQLWL